MRALPTASVPGVDEKLRRSPGTVVSKSRGSEEPGITFTLLGSFKVLEAAFVIDITSNILRRTGGMRGDGSLTVRKNVDRDMFCRYKETLPHSGRDQ